jgi:excisionase family DNA binding protein
MEDSFLTTDGVLKYLQVNLRTVYRLIKAGKLPAVRVGRQWRFRKRDVDNWLDTNRPRALRAVPSPSKVSSAAPTSRP